MEGGSLTMTHDPRGSCVISKRILCPETYSGGFQAPTGAEPTGKKKLSPPPGQIPEYAPAAVSSTKGSLVSTKRLLMSSTIGI